jgi:hypothetical protein
MRWCSTQDISQLVNERHCPNGECHTENEVKPAMVKR